MRKMNFTDKLVNLYIVLLFVGFLLVSTVPYILGLSEESIAFSYRVSILAISLFLFFKIVFSKNIVKLNFKPMLFFTAFWIIYGLRILNDIYFYPIKLYPERSSSYYLQFAFGVVLIPSIVSFMVSQVYRLNTNWILKWTYRIFWTTLLLALFTRANSDSFGRDLGTANIGVILFGHYGASLAVISFYLLFRNKTSIKSLLFYATGIIIGFSGIVVSASKGPFIIFIFIVLILIILWYGNIKAAIYLVLLSFLLNYFLLDILLLISELFQSNIIDRILYSIEVGGDADRERLLLSGLSEFVDNPVFGNAFLIQQYSMEGSYPHNIILEALMATGAIGGLFFLLWCLKCIKTSILVIRKHSEITWIALLFIQYFTFGMFSGNLYSNDLFWITSTLLVGLLFKKHKKLIH